MENQLSKYINLDNLLIICPNNFKKRILEYFYTNKKIADVKFMDINEYKRNYFFDYDVDTIKYLSDNKKLSISNAKEIIDNLIYVDINEKYNNEKLDLLVSYKKELEANNLLIHNDLFLDYILSKNVLVIGYEQLNRFDKKIIKGNSVSIELSDIKQKRYTINEFSEIEEEIEFIYNSIYDLLLQGVDINKIYVSNLNDDYYSYIQRYNSYYPFKIDYSLNTSIYGLNAVKELINLLDTSKEKIKEYLDSINDNGLYSSLVSLLNKYAKYDYSKVKDLIIEDIKNTSIKKTSQNDVVKCADISDCFDDDEYVFVAGFNDKTPTAKSDIDYITDNIADLVNKPTSEEINIIVKDNLVAKLSNISNLIISYSKRNPFNNYEVSNLLQDYIVKNPKTSYEYSKKANLNKYGIKLDKLLRYNDQDKEEMGMLYQNYGKNSYLSYSNRFNYLTDKQIEELKEVTLSYSSMNDYSKCHFKYYLLKVLKINNNDETFNTKYGTLCHEVLKDFYNDKYFNFDESWNKNLFVPDNKMESFFLDIIKEEIRSDIEIIKYQKENSLFEDFLCEKEFNIRLNDNVSFKGFIDKILYKKSDDKVVVSIIDYKTGTSQKIDLKLAEFGLSLQLPSYMYLLIRSNIFEKDVEFAGIYLQHLLNKNRNFSDDKTILDLKNESSLLEGISTNDKDRLSVFDLSIDSGESSMIKSLSLKKDGSFSARSKVLSDTQFDYYVDLVEKTITDNANNISKGEFDINPKQIDGNNESCEYCPFEDICYKRNRDLKIISTREDQ